MVTGICDEEMGMEKYLVGANAITASSEMPGMEAEKSRFYRLNKDNPEKIVEEAVPGYWSPRDETEDPRRYLEFDFDEPVLITTILMKNNIEDPSSTVTMGYVPENSDDYQVITYADDEGNVFDAWQFNEDYNKTTVHQLDEPIAATKVRIYPSGPVELKVDLLGCLPEGAKTTPFVKVTTEETATTTSTPVEITTVGSTVSTEETQKSSTVSLPTERTTTPESFESTTLKQTPTIPTSVETVTTKITTETPLVETTSTEQGPTTTSKVVTSTTREVKTTTAEEVSSSTSTSSTLSVPTETLPTESTTTATEPSKYCDDSMGLEMGMESELNPTLTASSNLEHAINARLNSDKSWTPDLDNEDKTLSNGRWVPKPWLQVTFDRAVTVSSVITQGDSDTGDHVTEYTVSYSNDAQSTWHTVSDESGAATVFSGNADGVTSVQNEFTTPLSEVTAVRIKPVTWENTAALRVELRGCYTKVVVTSTVKTTKETVVTQSTTAPGTESTRSQSSTTPEVISSTTTMIAPTTSVVVTTTAPKSPVETTPGKEQPTTTKKVT